MLGDNCFAGRTQLSAAILDVVSDGIAVLGPDHAIVHANPALASMVGRSREMLLALPSFFALAAPHDQRESARPTPGAPLAPRFEMALSRADGVIVNAEIGASANGSGSTVLIVRDVTQRRRAEEAMLRISDGLELGLKERSDELREANAALEEALSIREQFLQVASHELRTPLTPLMLRLQSLLRRAEMLDSDGTLRPIEDGLNAALRHVRRLFGITEQLLDAARIEHASPLARESVDLVKIVRGVVDRMREDVGWQRAMISVAACEPVVGSWDPIRIEHMVDNLLSNATKYGAGRPIEVTIGAKGDSARLTVQDHGIGIAPEDHARIFGRFERAVSTSHYGGFGLGLWIVRDAVESHGGTITVTSELGTGATFAIELPRSAEPIDRS